MLRQDTVSSALNTEHIHRNHKRSINFDNMVVTHYIISLINFPRSAHLQSIKMRCFISQFVAANNKLL